MPNQANLILKQNLKAKQLIRPNPSLAKSSISKEGGGFTSKSITDKATGSSENQKSDKQKQQGSILTPCSEAVRQHQPTLSQVVVVESKDTKETGIGDDESDNSICTSDSGSRIIDSSNSREGDDNSRFQKSESDSTSSFKENATTSSPARNKTTSRADRNDGDTTDVTSLEMSSSPKMKSNNAAPQVENDQTSMKEAAADTKNGKSKPNAKSSTNGLEDKSNGKDKQSASEKTHNSKDKSGKVHGNDKEADQSDQKQQIQPENQQQSQQQQQSSTKAINNLSDQSNPPSNPSPGSDASSPKEDMNDQHDNNPGNPNDSNANPNENSPNNDSNAEDHSEDCHEEEEEEEVEYADSKDELLTMSFNQDGGCLAVGTGSGFRICNVSPFQETFRRRLGGNSGSGGGTAGGSGSDAGIAHIEMLYRTNLLALTGHSNSPSYPPNKVLIYDDHLQRTIGELSFRQKVLTTKLRRDRIVVVLRDRVYVYNFSDLGLLDKVHTGDNPGGLIGISMDNGGVGGSTTGGGVERAEDALRGNDVSASQRNGMVLACPSVQRGQVRVELYGLRRTTFVDAHESALGALALSVDGSLLATASERGTVIRLFDTRGISVGGGRGVSSTNGSGVEASSAVSSSIPLREFRRGVERATISCLVFSIDSCWLGCASDHGTVHVFQAQDPNSNDSSSKTNAEKKSTSSSSMTGKAMRMLPKIVTSPKKYLLDGEQSYAHIRGIPHPQVCAFVPDRERTIAVAGMDEYGNGCLLIAEFGKRTKDSGMGAASANKKDELEDSEARRLGYYRFFKRGGAASMHSKPSVRRRRNKGKEVKSAGGGAGEGAYIDDNNPIDTGLKNISIGNENEDDFVPIDYNEKQLGGKK